MRVRAGTLAGVCAVLTVIALEACRGVDTLPVDAERDADAAEKTSPAPTGAITVPLRPARGRPPVEASA